MRLHSRLRCHYYTVYMCTWKVINFLMVVYCLDAKHAKQHNGVHSLILAYICLTAIFIETDLYANIDILITANSRETFPVNHRFAASHSHFARLIALCSLLRSRSLRLAGFRFEQIRKDTNQQTNRKPTEKKKSSEKQMGIYCKMKKKRKKERKNIRHLIWIFDILKWYAYLDLSMCHLSPFFPLTKIVFFLCYLVHRFGLRCWHFHCANCNEFVSITAK